VAEDKKSASAGKDLTSKIATAYRNIPPEERQKTLHGNDDIQNPELDRAFEKMVETYRPKRAESSVVPFPRSASPVPQEESEDSSEGDGYECPECGHMNPDANKFCGMCGAAQDGSEETFQPHAAEGSVASTLANDESRVRHHHHYYHHHHYRNNPYLLVAVMLLLGVIAWQELRSYRQDPLPQRPASQIQVVTPHSVVPAETKPEVTPVPSSPPSAAPSKPAAKPRGVARPATRDSVTPLPTRVAELEGAPVAPPESAFRKFMSNVFPSLVPPPTVVPRSPNASPAPSPAASSAPKQ
jgi:hypothetical protein